MIPRPMLQLAFSAFFATAFAACGGGDEPKGVHNAVDLPSSAELEAEAAEAIDSGNADDEFDKLKAEIDSGS